MKKTKQGLAWLVLAALMQFLFPTYSVASEGVGMVTGSSKGTYYRFGLDMKKYAEQDGLLLDIKESAGSLRNIERINSRENAAFGIVQADVLTFLATKPEMKDVVDKLRVIFPFYLEEIHVFANTQIQSLSDLNGKRVSIGVDGSGVWLTSKNIFNILGIELGQEEHLDTSTALQKVLIGELDAMIYVAGKPTKAFDPITKMANSGKPEIIDLLKNVHFVPVTEKPIFEETYEKDGVYLGPEDYPWMAEKVPTAAVRALLVSFDFSSGSTDYYKLRCSQLATLGKAIWNNISKLQEGEGHQKWNEVHLQRTVPKWKHDTCSRSNLTINNTNPPSTERSKLQERLLPYFN